MQKLTKLFFILTIIGAFMATSEASASIFWDKTFPKSDKVIHDKVSYKNRYGIKIVADMYMPKDIEKSKKYAAILVGPPYGGVKEQGPGIYAQTMAERGFVTLAFDPSHNGESGGDPKHISSIDMFVEDFSAGVDFLGTRKFVDREKIGVIGVCGSGAFSLTAAQIDPRIKAISTVSMYNMSRVIRKGWNDTMTKEQRTAILEQLGQQRWKDFENGKPAFAPHLSDEDIKNLKDPITSEFMEYYRTPRGQHPRSIPGFSDTSVLSFMNFSLLNHIKNISPRPILFIMGENAHSRYMTEDAYKMASQPKELYIVPGARHIDLYDDPNYIPFDKLESFFRKYLK